MQRAAWIFLAAILLPCLVLAWLAIRSEEDQQVILQHQQAIIDQGVTDSLAQNVRAQMDAVLADFVQTTQQLLAGVAPSELANGFSGKISVAWPLAQVGFAVDLQGKIYAPTRLDGIPALNFRRQNESFLSNREDATVYSNAQNQLQDILQKARTTKSSPGVPSGVTDENSMDRTQVISASTDTASDVTAALIKAPAPATSGGLFAPTANPREVTDSLPSPALEAEDQSKSAAAASPPQTGGSGSSANGGSSHQLDLEKSISPPAAVGEDEGAAPSATALPVPASSNAASPKTLESTILSTTSPFAPAAAAPAGSVSAQDNQSTMTGSAMAAPTLSANVAAAPMAPLPVVESQQIARIERQVAPQENSRAPDAVLSNVVPAQSRFRQLIGHSTSGSIARFLEDKLCLLVWSLPAQDSIVFGAQLNQDKLVEKLRALVQPGANRGALDISGTRRADYCLALLDDKGQPVALSKPGFKTDWKHPFVATEIGSALPHWEAALYLVDPHQVSNSARVVHFTIGLIILLLFVAILAGGSLIGVDVGRQMRLAQQKTDFVSNVSHELKTPLTSIRMFADMLAEGRVEEPEKRATYLRIISAESARLTRLINNVLDFARLERGAPSGERHLCDLAEAAREVVKTCQPHLEGVGVTLGFEMEAESLPVMGDRDALSQIILNLISNAEKYGGGEITVRVRRQDTPAGPMGCVDVLDRGPGIPARHAETVFAPFRRLDDSLASGVPGSGLGLTLARRMARDHGGDVTLQTRVGGGSCFTLVLPLVRANT